MNCIDVHRKLSTDPNNTDEAILSHLEECIACTNFLNSVQKFNQSLTKAAKIEVPDGLAERILLKQSFKQHHQSRFNRLKLYAFAASLIIVVGVSLNLNSFNHYLDRSLSLEEIAINHVTDELEHLHENKNIQLASLNNVLQPFKVKFNSTIGKIRYAGTCPIRNSRGAHLVVQVDNDTATLLLMPGEHVSNRITHTKGRFKTTIIPIENGSVAIVTNVNSKSSFENRIEKDIIHSLIYI